MWRFNPLLFADKTFVTVWLPEKPSVKLKQKQFKLGDKPEKLLAQQLKGDQAASSVQSKEINDKTNDRFRLLHGPLHF